MKKKIKKGIFSLVIILCFFLFVKKCVSEPNDVKITIDKIKDDFKGVVIKKYSTRDVPPTHLQILVDGKEKIDISPNGEIVDAANIGDSLIKIKNENWAFLKSEDDDVQKYFYTRISYKNRRSKLFPKEWRNKWLESSKWDKNEK